ncbi:integrating conjugative element protein [Vreelandella olivaria]|uniref:integrating conjugative element protein n=1 Tax=Vreelandella olivaria TaxID=390919 RepID=UPI00201ECD3F|nr:integrating conjugative element protein [Halomonas olivaria]
MKCIFSRSLLPLAAAMAMTASQGAVAQSADHLYYQIGGASPFSISAGRGYNPHRAGIGVRWNMNATCGNFDIGATVSNQLNGATQGFQNMMGQVVQNAQGAVASLPAMIIQRANPGLYDLLSNGVLQGRMDFDRSKLSCQNMAERMADMAMGDSLMQRAQAENWQVAAQSTSDVVAAQRQVEQSGGDNGVTWVGGQRRGGSGQQPVRVVEDTATAGYNLLHGRSDVTSSAPVSGGGGGWGSVATDNGTWSGGGGVAGGGGGGTGECLGGMCTVWGSPSEAAEWTSKVLGEDELQTCDSCEKRTTQAGTGLMRELETEQQDVHQNLVALVNGSQAPSPENLRAVSAGDGLTVSRSVIEALREDPQADLLVHRLASEMAIARVMTKALWARRALLAGASDPGVAENSDGMTALDRRIDDLNRDIDMLRSEMEIRQALASSAAGTALQRASNRADGSMTTETLRPGATMDSRGRPSAGEEP